MYKKKKKNCSVKMLIQCPTYNSCLSRPLETHTIGKNSIAQKMFGMILE